MTLEVLETQSFAGIIASFSVAREMKNKIENSGNNIQEQGKGHIRKRRGLFLFMLRYGHQKILKNRPAGSLF